MKRKLIKQGKGALTISLPKEWVEFHGLKAGEEVDVNEEENDLLIKAGDSNYVKTASINLDFDTSESYRSIIGGLYRGGFDEINVDFTDKRVIPDLQKAVDSLYGFEVLDVNESGCTIKYIHKGESTDITSHIRRIIHTIKTMQTILGEDIKAKQTNSKNEILQFRNNVLKQRDLILKIIKNQKLLDNQHFPYYNISICLWNVARNYYLMYLNLGSGKKYSPKSINFLNKTNKFFSDQFNGFTSLSAKDFIKRNKDYQKIRSEGLNLMNSENSILVSFCINIILSIQSADSSIFLLNHK